MPVPTETVAGTPADPTVRYVPLTLGGTTYQLCFDFDAIAKAEEMTGLELLFGADLNHVGIVKSRAMLLASMLKAHPHMTAEKLTPFMNIRYRRRIEDALIETWVNSLPPEADKENPPGPGPSPANG